MCADFKEPVPPRTWMSSRKSALRNKSQASRALLESLHGVGNPALKASLYVWTAFREKGRQATNLLQREAVSPTPAASVGCSPNQAFDEHMLSPKTLGTGRRD